MEDRRFDFVTLRDIPAPKFHDELDPVYLSDETMKEHRDKIRQRMQEADLDVIVVYSDIEHGNNFEYLTGFLTRFEEGLLVLHRDGTAYLLVGNENTKMINYTRIEATLIHVPFFSLPNMPMEPDRPLVEYLKDAGLNQGMKVGLIGWKMFTGSHEQHDQLYDLPHYLVQTIAKIVGTEQISNRIDLFIGEHGARIVNNANELARYEFGSSLASDGVDKALNHVALGISEMELASDLNKWGQRPSVVTVASTGERFNKANLYPSRKTVNLGDKMSLTVGYKGGLSCRVGYAVNDESELPEQVSDYIEVIAKPYYASIVNWLENIHIGMSGDAMYQVTESFIPQAEYHWTLNPGHLCADEEWLTCPIYPGSKEILKSGMLLQVDIIPTMPGYAGANCESGIALADETLRASIKEEYPAMYERFMKRRAYMINVLGIQLPEEVLLMNDTVAYYRPFFLNRTLAFVKK